MPSPDEEPNRKTGPVAIKMGHYQFPLSFSRRPRLGIGGLSSLVARVKAMDAAVERLDRGQRHFPLRTADYLAAGTRLWRPCRATPVGGIDVLGLDSRLDLGTAPDDGEDGSLLGHHVNRLRGRGTRQNQDWRHRCRFCAGTHLPVLHRRCPPDGCHNHHCCRNRP